MDKYNPGCDSKAINSRFFVWVKNQLLESSLNYYLSKSKYPQLSKSLNECATIPA